MEAAATQATQASWAGQISLVTLLAVIFAAGILYARVNGLKINIADLKESFAKDITNLKESAEKDVALLRASVERSITELKGDFKESAKDQGGRLGKIEGKIEAIEKGQEIRDDFTGKIGVPHGRSSGT